MPRIALVDPAAFGERSAGRDGGQWNGRHHPAPRELHLPQGPADSAGSGRGGLATGHPGDCRSGRESRLGPAREAMAHAAMLSGMAFANSGWGWLTGSRRRWAFTAASAWRGLRGMLPVALAVNRHVRQAELAWLSRELFGGKACTPSGRVGNAHLPSSRERFGKEARTPEEEVDVLIAEITSLCDRVGVPRRLSEVGVAPEQILAIARDSRGSSMSGNPRELSDAELVEILQQTL